MWRLWVQSLINGSLVGSIEQACLTRYCCTSLSLIDGTHFEDILTVRVVSPEVDDNTFAVNPQI
jgi:hypothetical protein